LDKQQICKGQLCEIVEERPYETETHRSEQTWNEREEKAHGENARDTSSHA